MKRHLDWLPRLYAYLAEAEQKPFRWGEHDCALHAANAVLAMTGEDLAADARGVYSDLRGSLRWLKDHGAIDPADYAALVLPEIHPFRAQAGDVAAVESDFGTVALGVVEGPTVAVIGPDGMGRVALTEAKRAFRV